MAPLSGPRTTFQDVAGFFLGQVLSKSVVEEVGFHEIITSLLGVKNDLISPPREGSGTFVWVSGGRGQDSETVPRPGDLEMEAAARHRQVR